MAIKTKKISELGKLVVSAETIETISLLGVNSSGVTGKVDMKDVLGVIRGDAQSIAQTTMSSIPTVVTTSIDETEISSLKTSLQTTNTKFATVEKSVSDLVAKYKTFTYTQTQKVNELETKVAALEAFVHALQVDGYLTLANIKRLAAEHCPCEATHEEQSAE
jgi:phage I-like protein